MSSGTVVNSQAEAAAVAEVVRKHIEPRMIGVASPTMNGEAQVLVVPAGLEAKSIKEFVDEWRDAPERRTGSAQLTDLASFIAHAKRFADSDSAIFADRTPEKPALVAVLDYHRAGADSDPRFGEHRSRYAFPLSDEWRAWMAGNGRLMEQAAFAQCIEDRLADVADPASAGEGAKAFVALLSCGFASAQKLLELSRGLTVHVGARVRQHVNLATGEGAISFEEEHSDGAGKPLKIPGAFLLALPVFRGGALYQVPARLRYRASGASVSWSYELYRASAVLDHAIAEACEQARTETGLPLYMGTPEA